MAGWHVPGVPRRHSFRHRRQPDSTGLRSAGGTLYRLPRCRTSMGERGFSYSGPRAWNALPSTLRDISDRARFRKLLKTHLFDSSS